ncbi:MAG TPA: BadF/BadG/BcrA/BcrD ATPase family protein [Anaerolineales bacterium]|jgi:N-acetylglucosamine kinase-like BadF-type ATPase|nr:BadF/BadG/BcrA/BcrD ATPase family protein [Anaerolineales bacterium]
MRYYLGADLGATKTHTLIVDETGRALGFGESGPANHESVGYEGMFQSMQDGLEQARRSAGLKKEQIAGAGFGVAGYDWPSEMEATASVIDRLKLNAPYKFVNDSVPGLIAGAEEGWGVVVVSGTGSNCRGWDREHKSEGRVTGHGVLMGEGAGASELIHRCMQVVGYSWTRRIPKTALADALVAYVGAKDLEDLMRGYTTYEYHIGADAARIVFRVAEEGDEAARNLICWAGTELGEIANAVIRQLAFENLAFDVVLTGSMFEGGTMLIEPMRETIHKLAPKARLVRLQIPPVVGAVLLGMEADAFQFTPKIRKTVSDSISVVRNVSVR